MIAVETTDLSKYYARGKIVALRDVSLKIESGQIFSLLGPNGAGKTTMIKLLLGIVFPTSGDAKILGHSISDYRVHSRLGYLSENHRFPDFLTAEQFLYYYGKINGVNAATLQKRIPELLKLVKLKEWSDTKIRKFSKGMQQRLGIAQALINDPELLFMDEPTDGIDPVGRRQVRDILKSLRDRGKTVFLNSHLLSEVERISDEVAILKNGELLQKGSVDDFISIQQQYQFHLGNGGEHLEKICQQYNIPHNQMNGEHIVTIAQESQLNMIIDELRAKQTVIQAIIPRKITLEDFFIEVIKDKEVIKE